MRARVHPTGCSPIVNKAESGNIAGTVVDVSGGCTLDGARGGGRLELFIVTQKVTSVSPARGLIWCTNQMSSPSSVFVSLVSS